MKCIFSLITLLVALTAAMPVRADTAVEIFSAGARLEELGQWEKAARQYERAMAMSPGYTDAHFRLGVAEIKLGRYELAEKHLLQTLSLMPGHIKAQAWLGVLYADTGRPHEALDLLEQASATATDDVSILVKIGDVHISLNHPEKAQPYYETSIEKDPEFSAGYTGLGRVMQEQGDYGKAMDLYLQALGVNPGDSVAHLQLAGLFIRKGMYAQAEAELSKLKRSNPDSNEVFRMQALLAAHTKSAETARAMLLKAIEIFPEDPDLHYELGLVQKQLEQFTEAIESFSNAARLRQGFAGAHVQIAQILSLNGDAGGALARLQTAVRLDANHAEAHYELAVLLHARGDMKQARMHYEKARALGHKENALFEVLFNNR